MVVTCDLGDSTQVLANRYLGQKVARTQVVLTRMLFSSCPILYWYCASILVDEDLFSLSKDRKNMKPFSVGLSISRMAAILSPTSYPSTHQKVLLLYFYAYILIGCIMHPNFLPWT
ncbi:unnamed protein product [Dibothriocephalus latus]|uniref:GPI mannosyltransferase 2 n=1 Tax=Dibothriocephalus latus TaxID=60516 RepID=A0A3P7LGW1_DIBLA|nr:unnamed protein product [Dibothriocephalus latus]